MLELNSETMDEVDALYDQYRTVKDTIRHIDAGAAYVASRTPEGYTDTDNIFEGADYLHRIRGDLLYYRQDLRKQIISLLQEEDSAELGYEEKLEAGIDEIHGIPKNDYRRHGADVE